MEYGAGGLGGCLSPIKRERMCALIIRVAQSLRTIKLTECCVREHFIHKLMVPSIPRQRERPRRYVLEFVSRVFLVEPLGGLLLLLPLHTNRSEPNVRQGGRRDATHRSWVHAGAALALAATLQRLHLAVLLREHRLRVGSTAHSDSDPDARAGWHARRDGPSCCGNALALPFAENEDGWLVVRAQWVLSDWLGLQRRWDSYSNNLKGSVCMEKERD
jgi:hypothetical protein